ncbi:MAG: hypothetical protein Q8N44_11230 [Rubrivivax sp.]|nr:hypothetical protein [Rubrivivax sp.]
MQNFNENASVLVMLALYAGLLAADPDIRQLMPGLGLYVAAAAALLWRRKSLCLRAAGAG